MKGLIFPILLLSAVFCQPSAAKEFRQIDWVDLLPKADYEAIVNAPEVDHSFVPGEAMPEVDANDEQAQIERKLRQLKEERFAQAMVSVAVKPELNKQAVKIAGFIVPLEFAGQQKLSEFFLVPYFGACMHLPPPPPNQIIHVRSEEGIKIEDLYSPYWLSGKLEIKEVTNEVAHSAYGLNVEEVSIYAE